MQLGRRVIATVESAATVILVGAAAVVFWKIAFGDVTGEKGLPENWGLPQVEIVSKTLPRERITNILGSGRVAIVEFSDFQCPFCAGHAQNVFPLIKRQLIDSGEARYVALHLPLEQLHPRAMKAAEAAECAAKQQRFWPMHDRLFSPAAALSDGGLRKHAEAIGLDVGRFQNCLATGETLNKIRADRAAADDLGLDSTPVFFVGLVRDDGGVDLVRRFRGLARSRIFTELVAELTSQARN